MQQNFIPVRFDKSHIVTIGERLYTQSLDLIRELVANAYDADASRVQININSDSIIVQDNGEGMDRDGLKQYFTIGSTLKRQNPISPKFKRVRIGEFGIGKFAVLSICSRFEIYTRSKDFAATLIFDRKDFEAQSDWNIPFIEHQMKDNDMAGTRVTLFDIKKTLSILDLERHLANIFPLSDKNFSIFINGEKLHSKYIPGERFRIRENTKFGTIHGEIIISSLMLPKEIVGVGIRVKGVLVKRDTFQIEKLHSLSARRLTGEINANFLPITASRSDFIKDSAEYKLFEKIISKKLRRVIRSLEKSAIKYRDKKAEKVLSDALLTIRRALRKNSDILLLNDLPLFAKSKRMISDKQQIGQSVISTALSSKKDHKDKGKDSIFKKELKKAFSRLRPKVRRRVKTLLRDKHKVIKKIKIGGNELLVSFTHMGQEERESFTEAGIIFINRDSRLFRKIERKKELMLYHLIRLVTQEIIKFTSTRSLELAFSWQGKLIKDAFLEVENLREN